MIALIIITTDDPASPHKKLWQQITTNKDNILNEFWGSVISDLTATIYIDTEHVFLCIKEQGGASTTERNTNTTINDISETLSEAYICYHSTDPRLQINPDQIGTSIRMKYAEKFKHGDENLYPKIESVVSGIVNLDESTTSNFKELCEFIKKKSNENLKAYFLHLFLPLDIDMQALEILWNDGEKRKANKHIEYLKEMLENAIGDHYKSKFDKTKKLIDEITDGKLKTRLLKVIGGKENNQVLYGFLECVDNLKEKEEYSKLVDKDVQELHEYFKTKGHDSFHDWYCALAECLRREEACK